MKNEEFHIPFINSLYLVAFITIVSMVSVRLFVPKVYSHYHNSQEYASLKSHNELKVVE